MSDGDFDDLAKKINPEMKTGSDLLDNFFKTEFGPDTGQWIHLHPELDKLEAIYYMYKNQKKKLIRFGAKIYEYK